VRGLLRLAAERRAALSVALVLALVADAATLAQPVIIGRLLDAVGQGREIRWLVSLLVLVFVVGAALTGFGGYLLARTGEQVLRDLRIRLAAHLLRMRVADHDHRRSGDLLSRAGGDTMTLRSIVTSGPISALTGAATLIASLVLMGRVDLLLLGVTVATMAVAFGAVAVLLPRVKPAAVQTQVSMGRLLASLDKSLRAIRTVKSSLAEDRELREIREQAGSAYEGGLKLSRIQSQINPAIILGVHGSFLVVLGIGGGQVATGHLTISQLITFLLYLTTLAVPLVSVGQLMSDLQRGLASFARVNEILCLEREPAPSAAGSGGLARGAAEVRFEDVDFGYGERRILDAVSFRVPPGTHTAIVGPSGAGKSTALALVERFYEAEGGRVLVDGRDVAETPLNELRRMIAYVEQETPVLAGTVAENVRYACPDATDEEVASVVAQVGLSGLVERLPEGMDTDVGDAGVLMSGGERQRIAIARALLGSPRVLLLDEATSQLDALNEMAMRETVRGITGPDCTVVTVAHRLSTVVDADQIIVLSGGRVAGSGTHEELLATSEVYRDLVQGQLLPAAPPEPPSLALAPSPSPAAEDEEPEVLAAGLDALTFWRKSRQR
jgi:ABC-type multidrug transport system fused ATPase/permease subunit